MRAAVPVLALALLAAAAPRSAPVSYTTAQAAHGRFLYYQHCAECHGGSLGGNIGPALAGPDARLQWESGQYVFEYVSVHMPHGEPGTLSKDEYVDIMAFLYQQQGRSPGRRPLDARTVDGDLKPMGNLR